MAYVCPNCGNTDFAGIPEGDAVRCPVPGCGCTFTPGKTLSREPSDDSEVMWVHPRGGEIRVGDTLVVREGQAARFVSGGTASWLTGPLTRTVGYEWRSEEEILRARQTGEEIPRLSDTSLAFVDLRVHRDLLLRFGGLRPFWKKIAIRPVFRADLSVSDPRLLWDHVPAGAVLTLQDVCRWTAERLQNALEEQIRALIPADADDDEIRFLLERTIHSPSLAVAGAADLAADLGIRLDRVVISSCELHRNWCSECGLAVDYPAEACPSGHPIRWCPLCRTVIHRGTGRCAGGHQFVWCPYCRMNVHERCLVHHGGVGPFQPDMKVKGE